ncbi:MAG: RnfABCDGE type electron transport complex subunit D [Clostridia bacterium]|nr:RnfABCDGE type electron transport complex subunit D [Clostridia bacterium]
MTEQKMLVVTSSPHAKHTSTTQKIMLDVIIALLPALGWAVYQFGIRSLILTVVTVLTCMISEEAFCRIVKRPSSVHDLSCVVTGLLLAFNLPVTIPMWMAILGAVFAIVVVKMLFGGIGQNIVNPALAARVFMFLSFSAYMQPSNNLYSETVGKLVNTDVVASATPLSEAVGATAPIDLFLGNTNGVLGEVSALCLLLGGVYLLLRRVITWHIPVAYLGTAALISLISVPEGASMGVYVATQLCGGGMMLAAIFMATDYATSPVTPWGRILFGVGCGAITMALRLFSVNTEGASFAILVMNLLVYYLDRFTMPKRFGTRKSKNNA